MSVAFPHLESLPQFAVPPYEVRRFSVDEYEQLGATGVLTEDDNVELLNGWIVKKRTKNPPHDALVDFLNSLLVPHVPRGWKLRVQNSLKTPTSVPEPDFVLVPGERKEFNRRHPRADEARFVIEVADSSLRRDREKASIYAAGGAPLYWIVNIPDQCVEVYSDPTPQGYANFLTRSGGEVVTLPMPSAELPITVADLFNLDGSE
jgi:Uma2 family endonuclease